MAYVPDMQANLTEILNLEQLQKLFNHFSVVTGLDVALFNVSGRTLLACRKADSICGMVNNCRKCREYISYGGAMSRDLGEPYIFACGCGLIMCSSPILFNDQLIGSISCGPAILWDADEIAVSEIQEKTKDMNLPVDAISLLRRIPSCSCVNVSSAAQILFLIVNSLTREHSVYLKQRARISEQQARISELIVDRKIAAAGLIEIEKRASVSVYPIEIEKELIAFVQGGNKQQATKILNNLLSGIFCFAEGNMDTIRVKIFELIAFLSRAAVDAGAPLRDVNSITQDSFDICEDNTDFEKLCFLTTRAMERFIDTVYQNRRTKKTSEHLTKAIDYILLHYADELTLDRVAKAVFVSDYYLSHLFRKEMNMTFSNYICRVRINRAKELLKKDKSSQIQEISEKVGFNDANYFAKIFKKFTGVTPKEYQAFF
ncbi:MAG: PocR ligand-binding domain-containing protein [Spirochaetaceae bacterium]|jgi:two-component system response regulator YesN|nr:PocR ligand-binding domain-containing protein [Spirochaetaceae bacterium]